MGAANVSALSWRFHVIGVARAGVYDEWGAVAALSQLVEERVSGALVRRATHVGDDQIEPLPSQSIEGILGGSAQGERDAERLECLPLVAVVVRAIVDPQDM